MAIVLLIGALGIAAWVLAPKRSSQFWRVAAERPDRAYDYLRSHPAWVVVDSVAGAQRPPEPRDQFTGPFMLAVPKLGRVVKLYCVEDKIEESQSAFLREQGVEPSPSPTTPWVSMLAMVYPVAGALFFARRAPEESTLGVVAYGIAQLGYVLVFAGIVAGSFQALGLSGRLRTIAVGLLVLVLETLLSNVAA